MKLKIKYINTSFSLALIHDDAAKFLGIEKLGHLKIINPETNQSQFVSSLQISDIIDSDTIAVSREIQKTLGLNDGDIAEVNAHAPSRSLIALHKKIDGEKVTREEIGLILKDAINGLLTPMELTAFLTTVETRGLDMDETESLAKEMLANSSTISFPYKPIIDHHSIGGVPGNKITLIVVPIIAAAGLLIPKTSSRAITGVAGTADLMEALAPVSFSFEEIKKMTEEANAVIVWTGATKLVPIGDFFINYQHTINLDPYAIMLCSILTKKKAAGADICIMDIPVGRGTKMKTMEQAKTLAADMEELGRRIGLKVICNLTYGGNPVGKSLGVNLEVSEALAFLEKTGDWDFKNGSFCSVNGNNFYRKCCSIAGSALEAGGKAKPGEGFAMAEELIRSGKALQKMKDIIRVQGGNPNVTSKDFVGGPWKYNICADEDGRINKIENRNVVALAHLAGSPRDHGAGIYFHKLVGDSVCKGDPLFTLYAENETKLMHAVKYAKESNILTIDSNALLYS